MDACKVIILSLSRASPSASGQVERRSATVAMDACEVIILSFPLASGNLEGGLKHRLLTVGPYYALQHNF